MILLSSELRGGTAHSHPKTVPKTENSNCSDTNEKRHIFKTDNSRPFLSQQVVITQSVPTSPEQGIYAMPHIKWKTRLYEFLLSSQTRGFFLI